MQTPYVETNCIIKHNGKQFEAGGAVITDQYCVGYLCEGNRLSDWHGNTIGNYIITATWKTPHSFVSSTMHQVQAIVNGVAYTGRSAGVGRIFKGKRIANQPTYLKR